MPEETKQTSKRKKLKEERLTNIQTEDLFEKGLAKNKEER